MEENKKIMLFVLMVGFFVFTIYLVISKKNVLSVLQENYHREIIDSYQGSINGKYIDKENHNSTMIIFRNGRNRAIHPYFWDKVQVGDSISKMTGDSLIQVFRNGEKIILEIAPLYEKAIEDEKNKK
ncbi:hypothetical protein HX004_17390 [Myroides sp. 1354]|uniref:hypothetical protein n=1 Tax=unclassified Myroides TaxID=2642485 RepID=UPI002578F2EE|nr:MULTISPECIES: hypothetical protein [unclassified Myroides]MDM1046594.1 hypothetical protein [Myroides sp. R163-1]MDM1057528.1 hypothetical protein [Myroides sp. 1354]MDM1070821.1 hypothetical protein [Myroides sp. 1372]